MRGITAVSQILCLPAAQPQTVVNDKVTISKAPQVEPRPELKVHKGVFVRVTVAAIQNLLFMMRVASKRYSFLLIHFRSLRITFILEWKRAYSEGQKFSRKTQLPYCK